MMEGDVVCEACGGEAGVYTVATPKPIDLTDFTLCPGCAVRLVDEIAYGLPDDYLDVLVATVQRRAARRAEREAVAS